MFVVSDADAAAIRAVYEQSGELSAAVELRRLFPGITDNTQARECARTIAGWKPLPLRPVKRMPKPPRLQPGALTGAGRRSWRSPGSVAARTSSRGRGRASQPVSGGAPGRPGPPR